LLARRRERFDRAVRLWAAESAILAELGLQRDVFIGRLYDAEIAALRAALPADEYEQTWDRGSTLDWLEAIEMD
jgi:hypothetical protein